MTTPTPQPGHESVEYNDLLDIYKATLAETNHKLVLMEARLLVRDRELARLHQENKAFREKAES